MGCCSKDEDKVPQPFRFKRKCTDLFMLLVFFCFLVGMCIVTGYAFVKGDYKKIVNGIDFLGCTCDTSVSQDFTNVECSDGSTELGKKSVFMEMASSDKYGTDLLIMCAASCPEGQGSEEIQLLCYDSTVDRGTYWAVGSDESSQEADVLSRAQTTHSTCTTSSTNTYSTCPWVQERCGRTYGSNNIAGYCLPTANDAFIDKASSLVDGEQWTQAFNSINNGKWVILGCTFFALFLGFLYMFLLRFCAGPLTWLSMGFIFIALVLSGVFLLQQAQTVRDSYTGDNSDGYKDDQSWRLNFGGGITILIVAFLFLCFCIFMCKRINLAIDCIKYAGKCIIDVPFVVSLPVLIFLLAVGVTAFWLVTTVFLFSAGEVKSVDPPGSVGGGVVKEVELDTSLQRAFLYHLFGFFWVTQFLVAFVELSIAWVACQWFFSDIEADGKRKLAKNPTWTAVSGVLRYHLGSVAFGSLIIAIIKMIRAIIEYVDAKTKHSQNRIAKAVICCCKCCMWCLEKCMKFINRQAYIQIALTGSSFCVSAKKAFQLLTSNFLRIASLTVVSTIFLFLGKLFVVCGASLLGYIILTKSDKFSATDSEDYVASPFVAVTAIAIAAYVIGALLMDVYGVTIDSMLMCLIHDEKHPMEGGRRTDPEFKKQIEELGSKVEKHGVKHNTAEKEGKDAAAV